MRLTRRFALIVAWVQLGAGIAGIILSSKFSGVSYRPARDLLDFLPDTPGLWWSGLLTFLSAGALAALWLRLPAVRTWFAMLMGYWSFWVVLWAWALPEKGSGPWAPFLAAIIVIGNARPVLAPSHDAD